MIYVALTAGTQSYPIAAGYHADDLEEWCVQNGHEGYFIIEEVPVVAMGSNG